MKTKNIEHNVLIRAKPEETYDALMNGKNHSQFTGAAFSCYGGYITGITLKLKPDKHIVQAWRSRDWPEGHYSIVTFALAKKSGGNTQLHFTQVGVPTDLRRQK